VNKKTGTQKQPGMFEFVALMAFTTSLVALSVDAMLPAFPDMIRDLGVAVVNDMQLIISLLFIGMALGQLFYGPLSDTIGRKPAMYLGFGLFIIGSVLSMIASDFEVMLAGRFLQGVGAAGPRTVAIALIRDRYHGSEMARIMSFVMTVFMMVPIFAPALGQFILLASGWRAIFASFVILSLMTLIWLAIRQPETLLKPDRLPLSFRKLRMAAREVLRTRLTMVATVVSGCVSGTFIGYLNVSQRLFQEQYQLGKQFPLYFALLAIAVGLASIMNGTLVIRFGMHKLANLALLTFMVLSWVFFLIVLLHDGHPPLWLFMPICLSLFFSLGLLFGNLNSIAMEPLGHIAGTGAAVIGSIATLLAVALGFITSQAYDGSLFPMAIGFASLATVSLLLTRLVKNAWLKE